ncbi:MAG: Flagellar protein FliL (modular protein) [Nitrospira sp.]|nr:flagellar basal body-associated FliL family protein [Nitrospira sp.]ULA59524.1 MAG: Flagellar protein FliL (modular protein) [Nitrospira sp.]
MTLRVGIAIFLIITSLLFVAGYLGGISYSDLMPRTFSIKDAPVEPQQKSAGLVINLPPIVAPVDDGERFYYVQANLAVEIDRPATGTLIRDRHDTIDRYVMEMLHTYPIQDLRTPGNSATLRDDLKRTVNKLLPQGRVRNVYITSWLITPIGY